MENYQLGSFFTAQPSPLCLMVVNFHSLPSEEFIPGKAYFAIPRTAFSFKFFCSSLILLCHPFRSALIIFLVSLYLPEVLSCAQL